MHLYKALGVADNYDMEGIYNIIVNVLQMVLVETPVLSPRAFPLIEPKLPLEVDALIHSLVCMSVISRGVRLHPSP